VANAIQALSQRGQAIWCDNISRGMIESGELKRLIDLGVTGVTSNPTIFMKAISGGTDYDGRFEALLAESPELMAVYEGLVLPDIADAADALRPIYDRTGGGDGFISLEVSPKLAYDTAGTLAEARRLFTTLNRPNVFIKVPATDEGIPAIETLIGEGINVNITLIFSLAMYERVMDAYLAGLRRFDAAGGDLARVASVASFFVSRVDTLVDKLLAEKRAAGVGVDGLFGQAAVANARLAYARFEEVFASAEEFAGLAAKGAHVQRPVWASTSTKNPDYPDTLYVDGLVGPHTVNTIPPPTIDAVLDHGTTEVTIRDDLEGARKLFARLAEFGIHLDEVTDRLLTDGVKAFADSFDQLFANLEQKRRNLQTAK
jgi:transaldolase